MRAARSLEQAEAMKSVAQPTHALGAKSVADKTEIECALPIAVILETCARMVSNVIVEQASVVSAWGAATWAAEIWAEIWAGV